MEVRELYSGTRTNSIKNLVTKVPARLDSRPVASGYPDRLPTYKTMWPCQAATTGVPLSNGNE